MLSDVLGERLRLWYKGRCSGSGPCIGHPGLLAAFDFVFNLRCLVIFASVNNTRQSLPHCASCMAGVYVRALAWVYKREKIGGRTIRYTRANN